MVLRAMVLAVTALVAVGVSTRWWDTPSWRVPVVQAAFPLVGLGAIVWALLCLLLLWRRGRVVWALPAVVVALVPAWLAIVALLPSTVDGTAREEVVAASNLEFGEAEPEALVAAARDHEVDTLVLTEVTPEAAARLDDAGLAELLPHRVGSPQPGADGTVILSRHRTTPVRDGHVAGLFDQPVALVHAPTGDYTLRAMHPYPPTPRLVQGWHRQLGDAKTWVDAQPADLPLVLAGDFNASRAHPAYRSLAEGFTDAHRATGGGWVRTWPQNGRLPAFVELDHVLIRDGGVVDAGSVVVPGTDHSLVWARLALE